MKKTKVLAWCDGPTTTTGFGRVAREVLMGIHKTGNFDITCVAINFFGLQPSISENPTLGDMERLEAFTKINSIPANIDYAGSQDKLGRKILLKELEAGDYDILWILQDAFIVNTIAPQILELKKRKKFKVIFYYPIDTESIYIDFLRSTRIADAIVTYNKWSAEVTKNMLGDEVGNRLYTIYHGVSDKDFFELTPEQVIKHKFETLKQLKLQPDDVLVVRSDSNQQRKDWWKTLQIVGQAARADKRIKFYANTEINNNDYPLFALAKKAGLRPKENFFYLAEFTKNRNLTQEHLNNLYNIADIGISTSRGEGCGLFHYEMMWLGKPMLISNTAAHKEAVSEGAAIGIRTGENKNGLPDHNLIDVLPSDMGQTREVVDVQDGVDKLLDMVNNLEKYKDLAYAKAKKFMQRYSWEEVSLEWIALFNKVAKIAKPFIYEEPIHDSALDQIDSSISDYRNMIKVKLKEAEFEYKKKYNRNAPDIKIYT